MTTHFCFSSRLDSLPHSTLPPSFTKAGWPSHWIRGMALVHTALSDFVLFPREQSFFDSMTDERQEDTFVPYSYTMTSDIHQDLPDIFTSTYTSYPNMPVFSAQTASYDTPQLVVDGPKDSTIPVQPRYTSSTSPSNSMSHPLEHAPSVLSTASAQSTASSADGSPYPRATHNLSGQDLRMDPHAGLCIEPSLDYNEAYCHDPYPLPDLESEHIPYDSKYPGNFVGESQDISSTLNSSSYVMPSPISPSTTSRSPVSSTFPSPSMGPDISAGPLNITIDTILEEANDKFGTPASTTSPASASSSMRQYALTTHPVHPGRSPEGGVVGFRSPATPASAVSPFASRASSPFAVRQHEAQRRSSGSPSIVRTRSTPPISYRAHPYERPSFEKSTSQGQRVDYQTPFFNQSSGRFIPPLESSCWFSLRIHPCSFHSVLFWHLFSNFHSSHSPKIANYTH